MDAQKPFIKAGTHSGRFHADEVMATAILKEIYDVEVVRTRDNETLNSLEIIYDVGGGEFDHHQPEKIYREDGTPFAACGLIWNRFGRDVISYKDPSLGRDEIDSMHKYMDKSLIKGIDAIDNGLKTGEVKIPTMNISSIISGFNPTWDSEVSEDLAFDDAVRFASTVLENTLEQKFSNMKARDKVVEAYRNRVMKEVLNLDQFYPWINTLKDIDEKTEVLYVVYPSREGYILHTVKKGDGTFKNRKDLPKSWAGKREGQLSKTTGIEDAAFCHTARFIAGAKSYDSIMKMAEIAVKEPPENFVGRIFWTFKRFLS